MNLNGMEMMMRSLVKALGIDPDVLLAQVAEIRALFMDGRHHALQANERLARIEAKLGIENSTPVNSTLVISHETVVIPDDGVLSHGGRVNGGGQ